MRDRILHFFAGFFEDQDGGSSMTRLGCFIMLVSWALIAFHIRAIPERTPEFATMLIGFYGANCVRNAIQSFAPKKDS